jgi:hypothetical protein
MKSTACLLSFTPDGKETEYLESVSRSATTWTTDPNKAVHFFSEQTVPVTTVFLRFPMLEPLKENASQSEQNMRERILKWFKEHE